MPANRSPLLTTSPSHRKSPLVSSNRPRLVTPPSRVPRSPPSINMGTLGHLPFHVPNLDPDVIPEDQFNTISTFGELTTPKSPTSPRFAKPLSPRRTLAKCSNPPISAPAPVVPPPPSPPATSIEPSVEDEEPPEYVTKQMAVYDKGLRRLVWGQQRVKNPEYVKYMEEKRRNPTGTLRRSFDLESVGLKPSEVIGRHRDRHGKCEKEKPKNIGQVVGDAVTPVSSSAPTKGRKFPQGSTLLHLT
ncbi:hypothetical protein DL96DRAFT_365066 [Flagelloscypha sp. PMI_526]|nr:hypothetical protein DL96DRAFT_365066 [Flagelloscypha sp. PMI_526]